MFVCIYIDSVLDSDIHVLHVDVNETGATVFNKWTPNKEEFDLANEVFVDESKRAVFRVASISNKSSNMILVLLIKKHL